MYISLTLISSPVPDEGRVPDPHSIYHIKIHTDDTQ
jgi:hypothetical protein